MKHLQLYAKQLSILYDRNILCIFKTNYHLHLPVLLQSVIKGPAAFFIVRPDKSEAYCQ